MRLTDGRLTNGRTSGTWYLLTGPTWSLRYAQILKSDDPTRHFANLSTYVKSARDESVVQGKKDIDDAARLTHQAKIELWSYRLVTNQHKLCPHNDTMVARSRETQTADVQGYSQTAWPLRNLNTIDNKYLYQYGGKLQWNERTSIQKNWHTLKESEIFIHQEHWVEVATMPLLKMAYPSTQVPRLRGQRW
jgi:hypothetical protein